MKRRAFVTGATGFIGGHLVQRLLEDDWSVDVLRRGGSPTAAETTAHSYSGDTSEVIAAVEQSRPDIIFHLASLYLADHRADQISALVASNVLLTAQIAEAACACGNVTMINTGTAWQHRDGAPYLPVNLYAATKQAGEDLLRYYADARELSVLTLKLFDTYGPGDTRRKLVQLLVEAASTGEPLDMSPGDQRIDLTHVDDVVDAFLVAAERAIAMPRASDESFFVGGDRLSVRALADEVAAALDMPVPARFGERPYRNREVMEPAGAEPRLPGWRPATSLHDGIRGLAKATRS